MGKLRAKDGSPLAKVWWLGKLLYALVVERRGRRGWGQTGVAWMGSSAATYALVHAEVQDAPYGARTLDGLSPHAPIYAMQRLLRRHAGVVWRGLRDQSPFVGRERELALLHDHLATVMAGHGQVVGLVGEPGMGKTPLVTEFYRRVPGDQVRVYEGRCLSYGQANPYLPVRDILQPVCGFVEGDDTSMHTAAVQHRLYASGMSAEEDVALLCQLLDLPGAPECLERLTPQARQARTFALLRHLILDAAQQQPLVLVVESLHWSDVTSAAWLASLVERLAGAAGLLLGTYRPSRSNCVPPPASAVCGSSRASVRRRVNCWRRCMAGSPRGSIWSTSRRPRPFLAISRNKGTCPPAPKSSPS